MLKYPIYILSSFLLMASLMSIVVAYVQLFLFERMLKRDYTNASTFKTMSDENKQTIKKICWKIARGVIVFIVVVVFQYYKNFEM